MVPARPAFRPDIEGLRGLAILLVVGFHAGVRGLSGGFVGVDVFFVLSGFFITGLLARELSTNGSVDLKAFYGKRALRLLPALLVVLIATLAAVMWLYAPIDRATIAASARSVALYSGNLEFARGSVDYFSSGENPLLHTWSLAVEEQFYLVWPLLFVFVASLYASKTPEDLDDADEVTRKRLLIAIGIAGAVSLAASLWLTGASQPWAFFGMPTRIWEFALGGAVMLALGSRPSALGSDSWEGESREPRAESRGLVLQIFGLVAIGIGVLSYDRATPYPGVSALLPALGAVGLVVGGQFAPSSFVSRALGVDWLQWLGRMSYAWYLWHWPLVGIGAVVDPAIGVGGRLAWSAIALVLAWLTYRFIERPARDGGLSRIPTRWIAPAALGASVAAAVGAHGAMVAAQRQTAMLPQKVFAAAREDHIASNCWAATVEEMTPPCEFGDKRSSTVLMLLGDSHAQHWLAALDRAGREGGFKVVAMVKGGCPVAHVPQLIRPRMKRWYYECTRYREAMLRRIIAARPAAVVLSSWDHYMPVDGKGADWQVTPDDWRRGLRQTYSRLSSAGIKTVAIRGTPRTWFDVPSCLSRRAAKLLAARKCEYDRAGSLSRAGIAAQNDAARGLPIRFIDMNDQICATRRCGVMRNGIVIFTDDNHLTATFSRSVAPVLEARLAKALRN